MATTHRTPAPGVADRETALPAVRRRRRRRDWVRGFARVACVILAIVGTLPFVVTLVVRSAWARGWAAQQTERTLREQGLVASYEMSLRVWPLAVELTRLRVESSDGGAPLLVSDRVRVRPKLFALLAGKLAIDQIELDSPRVRAVVRSGKVTNLAIDTSQSKRTGPLHAPFNTFAVTDATIDLDVDGSTLQARALDLDVTAEDDPKTGSTFEIALHAGRASYHRERDRPDGTAIEVDDDALCTIEGRVRVEPTAILVRRLDGVGAVDLDPAPGTTPSCDLPATDKRRAELSLGHVHVTLPRGDEKMPPAFDGHVHVRGPVALVQRFAKAPPTDGWVAVDLDLRYGDDIPLVEGRRIPDASGTIEGHDLKVAQYAIAQELHSEVTVRTNVVRSPTTTIRIAGGTVTFTDTVVAPLEPGAQLRQTHLELASVDFTALLKTLAIHPHAHVDWDLREVHMPMFSGTFSPLNLDGNFNGKTYTFGVYDRPAEDRARERIFGFSEAAVNAHFAVRPEGVKFTDAHVQLPHSHVDGGYVYLQYKNDIQVDAPHVFADLEDLSPIGTVPLHGKAEVSAHVGGTFNHPEPEGDVKSIQGFGIADVSFGDLTSGHVKVEILGPEAEFTGVHAKKRDSTYDVATTRLRFGSSKGLLVDAVGSSPGFGFRDLLSMFSLEEDPRFDGLDATMAAHLVEVHVALGGPEDACGGGYLSVSTKGHLTKVAAYGEHFAQGDTDVAMRWYDRQRGLAGAEVDVRSFVLEKVQPPEGTRAGAIGTVLGSATIRRGGALAADVMVQGIPLSRVDTLGKYASQAEGNVSGVAHVTGDLDDFHPDAGFTVRTDLDVSGTRVRGVGLPPSHLDVVLTNHMTQQKRVVGHTRCGAPIGAPFDKAAFLADTSSHGDWTVNGSLLGGTVQLTDVVATRAKAAHVSGHVALRNLDLGAVARVLSEQKTDGSPIAPPASAALSGLLSGDIAADDIPLTAPAAARVRFFLGNTVVSRGGQKLTLKPPRDPVALADDSLTVPPLEVTLDTPDGFQGGFVVSGSVSKVSTDPTLAIDARLDPIDLSVLTRLVPKIDRASGTVQGSLHVTGKALEPKLAGDLHVKGDEIVVHGLPSALSDVAVDLQATTSELSASGKAKFAGGTLALTGSMPLKGFEMNPMEARVTAHDVRIAPADGIAATVDADLGLDYDPKSQSTDATAALPRVTGDVTVNSFEYTRPIQLSNDITSLAKTTKRTEVNAYDPALDLLTFDVRVRSKAPLGIRNNLAEVQLAIDSGTLEVTGTNQRVGLRGALRVLPSGRFHFQASDFDVKQGLIRFDDPTRIAPNVDITAVTEYRRYTDTTAGAAAGAGTGAGAGAGATAVSATGTRGGSMWRITLHAFGDADNLRVDMTSEPALSQEDIVLLLAVGMTRAELDQLQASSLGASLALNYIGATSGAGQAVKQAVPIIDDFRFGSAYSTVTGKTEPQLTVGKRLTNDVRASVTTGLSEDRELRSNIEWRLNNRLSVQGSYDNINDVSSSALGNLGVDLRWRLEFQ
jgi:translocation and assembly module TamB